MWPLWIVMGFLGTLLVVMVGGFLWLLLIDALSELHCAPEYLPYGPYWIATERVVITCPRRHRFCSERWANAKTERGARFWKWFMDCYVETRVDWDMDEEIFNRFYGIRH